LLTSPCTRTSPSKPTHTLPLPGSFPGIPNRQQTAFFLPCSNVHNMQSFVPQLGCHRHCAGSWHHYSRLPKGDWKQDGILFCQLPHSAPSSRSMASGLLEGPTSPEEDWPGRGTIHQTHAPPTQPSPHIFLYQAGFCQPSLFLVQETQLPVPSLRILERGLVFRGAPIL
jgi:hypothetical protein